MGSPTIYYYPDPLGTLETLTFPENLSDLQVSPIRETASAVTLGGGIYRRQYGSRLGVKIILENFTDSSFWYKLQSLSAHLERGGSIGFSLDHDKTWAGFLNAAAGADRGDTGRFHTPGDASYSSNNNNDFYLWNNSANVAADDMICICNANPEGYREFIEVDSVSAATGINTKTGLLYTYTSRPVLLRWRDFYPALKLSEKAQNSPIVTSNHRIAYTLDLDMEEDWRTLNAIYLGGSLQDASDGGTGASPDSMASAPRGMADTTAPESTFMEPTNRFLMKNY